MAMILRSARRNGLHAVASRNAAHVRPQGLTNRTRKNLAALFGGKHAMHEKVDVGV